METIVIVIAVVAGLVLAYNLLVLPANMAEEKGLSWWGFSFMALTTINPLETSGCSIC